MAITSAATEGIWLRQLYEELMGKHMGRNPARAIIFQLGTHKDHKMRWKNLQARRQHGNNNNEL